MRNLVSLAQGMQDPALTTHSIYVACPDPIDTDKDGMWSLKFCYKKLLMCVISTELRRCFQKHEPDLQILKERR